MSSTYSASGAITLEPVEESELETGVYYLTRRNDYQWQVLEFKNREGQRVMSASVYHGIPIYRFQAIYKLPEGSVG